MNALIRRKVKTILPTEFGNFTIYGYEEHQSNREHLALVKGNFNDNMLCRVHSECLTGEVLHSLKCDCKEQLELAFQLIEKEGSGIILYLRQEGRGIGLLEKLKAYELQSQGKDTVEANIALGHKPDERNYEVASLILEDLGVKSIRLLTNNPDKKDQLTKLGITVRELVPVIPSKISDYNRGYLNTKIEKMNHLINNLK